MIGGRDGCGWVNVFLVLAHLGSPGQNPESRKTIVVVQGRSISSRTVLLIKNKEC